MKECQLSLIDLKESYSLVSLKESCYKFVKKKFPCPVEGEDYEDYLQMLSDEADLEFVSRIRIIADMLEKKVLEPQKNIKKIEIKK